MTCFMSIIIIYLKLQLLPATSASCPGTVRLRVAIPTLGGRGAEKSSWTDIVRTGLIFFSSNIAQHCLVRKDSSRRWSVRTTGTSGSDKPVSAKAADVGCGRRQQTPKKATMTSARRQYNHPSTLTYLTPPHFPLPLTSE